MFVSILIPVYNAASHLASCWATLEAQTMTDFEAVFVNDGSTDATEALLQEKVSQEPRFRLVSQTNQGVSAARNAALAVAQGDYIAFMDVDDTLAPDFLEQLVTAARKYDCDVVFSGFQRELQGQWYAEVPQLPLHTRLDTAQIRQEVWPAYLRSNRLNSVCNKLFARALVQSIRFPVGQALGEDGVFGRQVVSEAQSLVVLDYCGYYYREVVGSATRNLLKHDYFQAALQDYATPTGWESLPNYTALQSEKFLRQVMMCLGLYTKKANGLSWWAQWRILRKLAHHSAVQQALLEVPESFLAGQSRFYQTILTLLKKKQVTFLFLALRYSHYKNKTK
ncbi:glycosyltransferase family 2 protein [Flavobacterium sp.]|uniref:glycosyltransferase family 2 protein n=1 Tax=Flavobacterium sp. TaxID=239 RepID=UPI0022C71E64|nr:glycosyltransferase family 2 protein [Flavobacterium sp.]MCZ8169799.1 glycosyltransferase family 2 protein [Flavobacterium sp.]